MKEESQNETLTIKPQEGFQQQFASSNIDVVFGGGILGGGKGGLLDSLVMTPSGEVQLKDIKVGDEICDPNTGLSQRVVQLHPISDFNFYRVYFNDGTSFDCTEGHLWKVKCPRKNNGEWYVEETRKMFEIYNSYQTRKKCFSIPITEPVEFTLFTKPSYRPIHPYIIGSLLGNGCMTEKQMKSRISIVTPFEEVAQRFVEYGVDMSSQYHWKNCVEYHIYDKKFRKDIENLGLRGICAITKFIPKEYKYSPINDRIQLMQGLIDADGSVDERGRMFYYTISEQLANDVAFVARSLGCWAAVRKQTEHKYTCKNNEVRLGQTLYRVRISGKDVSNLVSVKAKKDRVKLRQRDLIKRIESIEYLGTKKGRCITVSNDSGLYLVNNFTVTHNSFALVLAMAEPLLQDGDFRAMISRRSLQNQKASGGFVDTFKAIFGDMCSVKQSDSPRITFPSGAFCDLTYLDDTNLDKMRERLKGMQIDCICIDEITEMSWEAFTYAQTRNRGRSKTFTGKFFATLNPKRSHWTRIFLDWYIGVDGFIIPERNGCVRYFYINGSTVNDVVWGDSKEEVYRKCKIDIDKKLSRIGGDFTYKNMIKSFVFYQGKLSENKAMTENNPDYIGSVAASGGKMAQALFEGNFNVDPEEDEHIPIPSDKARGIFENDPCTNGDKWITVDLADYGTDNLVALAWNGFHAYDILVLMKSTPRENAMAVRAFAREHGVAENHIIYDATSGRYFNDYVPDAIPYISNRKPYGMYALTAMTLKDMCYLRLCKMIENGQFTFDEQLARRNYTHQNLKFCVSVENELLEELSVVRFDVMQSGKKKLWNKKKMNEMLGKGRSMDLADPCAMRMLPCAELEYGDELSMGRYQEESTEEVVIDSIFDETMWY